MDRKPKSLRIGHSATTPNSVICPECKKAGKRSKAFIMGSRRTLLGFMPYYDEDGNYVANDPNKTTTSYECSEGHTWQRTY